MNIIFNLLVILVIILTFFIIGNAAKKKISYLSFFDSILLGFVAVLGAFQIFALPFMVFQYNFHIFAIIFLFIYLLVNIFALYYVGFNNLVKLLKDYVFSLNFLIMFLLSAMLCVVTIMIGFSKGDGWLYTPMILSTLEQNKIYFVDHPQHFKDSYYLLSSVFLWILKGNNFLNLIIFGGFLENILVVLSLNNLNKLFFKRFINHILYLEICSILLSYYIFLPYFANIGEIFGHMFTVPQSGTLFLYLITIPLFFEYVLKERNNLLYFAIICLSGLGFSSSTTFMIFVTIIIYAFYNIIIKKFNVPALKVCLLGTFFCFSSSIIFLKTSSYLILIPVSLLILLLIGMKIKEKHIPIFKIFVIIFVCIFLTLNLLAFVHAIGGVKEVLSRLLTFNDTGAVRGAIQTSVPYQFPLISSLLFFSGCFYLYKNNKKHLLLIIVICLLFANRVVYFGFGHLISSTIYHRIMVLTQVNLVVIYGYIFILELLNFKYKLMIINVVVILLTVYAVYNYTKLNPETSYVFTDSFIESKLGTEDLDTIKDNVFEPGDKVFYVGNKRGSNISVFFQIHYNIDLVSQLSDSDYTICDGLSKQCDLFTNITPHYKNDNITVYNTREILELLGYN